MNYSTYELTHHTISHFRELPKGSISIFSNSYIQKSGLFIKTGIHIHVSKEDADFIRTGDNEKYEEEISRISKILGYPEYAPKISAIIKWAGREHYDKEKDPSGNLSVYLDFIKLLRGSNELKIGNSWYTIPPELLSKLKKPKHESSIRLEEPARNRSRSIF